MNNRIHKPPPATPLQAGHSQLDGLVFGSWFQEGSGDKINNLVGPEIGTLSGFAFPAVPGSGWLPGKFGRTCTYDGTDNHIDTNSNFGMNFETDLWSASAWFNVANLVGDDTTIIGWGDGDTAPFYYWLINVTRFSGVIEFLAYDGANRSVTSTINIGTGEWHHVAVTYNGANVGLYLDGHLNNSGAVPTKKRSDAFDKVRIGHTIWQSGGGYFNGQIDDVRIYNRALAQPEIMDIKTDGLDPFIARTVALLQPGIPPIVPLRRVTIFLLGDKHIVRKRNDKHQIFGLGDKHIVKAA